MRLILSFITCILSFSCVGCSSEEPNPVIPGGDNETTSEIRAVWIPDPSHTTAMTTYQNVLSTIALLDELNMNTIYLCTWARSQTAYKSQVLLNNSTYASKEAGYLFNPYISGYNTPVSSPTGDPVKDLITEAHKKNIKVIFWFEYGFMASNGVTPANNPILQKHPQWKGINSNGEQSNYNNTDYYFNAYNPEVQGFLLSLIEESISLYPEVDGIQGDDRMPAMPRNSGYDDYTVTKYKAEHGGQTPPASFNDASWVRWRLDILNNFAKQLYTRVKAKKNNAVVCFSPNPHPWSEDNLMQAWPQWISDNCVDFLAVQCYRNTIEAYTSTITSTQASIKAKTNKRIFNPGIILKNGSVIMNKDLLDAQMKANRNIHSNGEAFFYIEGLKDAAVQDVLKKYYTSKANFPEFK